MIGTIIDELKTIAEAYTEVETFIFEELSCINDDVSKDYPAILVNSRSVDYNILSFKQSSLGFTPNVKNTILQVFFFDTFKEAEQKTKTKQTKYQELEVIADKYISEVKQRTVNDYKDFELVSSVTGFEVDKVHNDTLVQIVYTLTFSSKQNCEVGTFNY